MCLYPKIIRNKRYTANKKNGGVIPPIRDNRVLWVPTGCGQCFECRKQEARKWQVRLMEDNRHNKNGKFIALTFSNESINKLTNEILKIYKKQKSNKNLTKKQLIEKGYELDNQIAILAVKRFRERWRKKYKKSIRHWLVTELGHIGTEHIHMHGILWTDEEGEEIERIWQYGNVWYGNKKENGQLENYVNEKTVNYIIKYVNKQDEDHEYYKPIILTSAGIGADYLERSDSNRNTYNGKETREYYQTRNGFKLNLPIYYRNKLYSEEERELLWLNKLDKNERWVGGEKVDISKDDKEYFAILGHYRALNTRLGFGTGEINWEKREYERQRRALKNTERIEKGMKINIFENERFNTTINNNNIIHSNTNDMHIPNNTMGKEEIDTLWNNRSENPI